MSGAIRVLHQSPAVEGQFSATLEALNWDDTAAKHLNATEADVRRALAKPKRDINDFAALISPAAKPFINDMVAESERLTLQRFGKTVSLFAPLYLSNTCANECTYCGFSMSNAIKRLTLDEQQIEREIKAIKQKRLRKRKIACQP